jgi:hypothetical protein
MPISVPTESHCGKVTAGGTYDGRTPRWCGDAGSFHKARHTGRISMCDPHLPPWHLNASAVTWWQRTRANFGWHINAGDQRARASFLRAERWLPDQGRLAASVWKSCIPCPGHPLHQSKSDDVRRFSAIEDMGTDPSYRLE